MTTGSLALRRALRVLRATSNSAFVARVVRSPLKTTRSGDMDERLRVKEGRSRTGSNALLPLLNSMLIMPRARFPKSPRPGRMASEVKKWTSVKCTTRNGLCNEGTSGSPPLDLGPSLEAEGPVDALKFRLMEAWLIRILAQSRDAANWRNNENLFPMKS
eukprot:CAMPEP_0184674136 /NCGR_PEP_ID=MMETSP0308-20130426/87072_1 /TAXON_ID=38269 /ORGANISM="Gloeochaete witrockiana, Strain SAG 46.84" /LENGTH=159 /DNA_ID=CAMNT_0027121709 /DNA_START=776 /DNA_END=1251 /DNA_ORIENTATION=+